MMYKNYLQQILVSISAESAPCRRRNRILDPTTSKRSYHSEDPSTPKQNHKPANILAAMRVSQLWGANLQTEYPLRGVSRYDDILNFAPNRKSFPVLRKRAYEFVQAGDLESALVIFREDMPNIGLVPNTREWTKLMMVVGRRMGAFEALRVFEAISFSGQDPDVVAFGAIVGIFCDFQLLDEALSLVRRMTVEFGLTPTIEVLYPILKGLERRKAPEKIAQILRAAKEMYGLEPDQRALRSFILAYIKGGDIQGALTIIGEVGNDLLSDTIITHEFLRILLLRKVEPEVAERFWNLVKTKPEGPDIYEYGIMMRIYFAWGQHVNTIAVIKEMLASKKRCPTSTPLNLGLRAAIALKNYELGYQLWTEFFEVNWHIQPMPVTYAIRARMAADERDTRGFIEVVNAAIPDNTTKSVSLILLRALYGCLIIFRAISSHDFVNWRRRLRNKGEFTGARGCKELPPETALEMKNFFLTTLERFSQPYEFNETIAWERNDQQTMALLKDFEKDTLPDDED